MGSFLPVERIRMKEIKQDNMKRLNTVQLITLCRVYGVDYAERATQSKKTNAAKRGTLWDKLLQMSKTTRVVKEAVYVVMFTNKE